MSDQDAFAAAIFDPTAPVPGGLLDPEGRSAGKRFDVYRNNVVVSLIAALRDGFPAISSLLGPAYFNALAGLFARAHPPKDPRLVTYGVDFPEFLSGFEPLAHLPYLGDIAQLELALRRSYHAADHTPFTADALARLPQDDLPNLTFALAPSVQLLRSAYPVVGIRAKALGGEMTDSLAQDVLIARPDFDPEPHILPPGAFGFLKALGAGFPIGAAATNATEQAADFNLAAALGLALHTQILTERPLP